MPLLGISIIAELFFPDVKICLPLAFLSKRELINQHFSFNATVSRPDGTPVKGTEVNTLLHSAQNLRAISATSYLLD
jgi:hypothetical protein